MTTSGSAFDENISMAVDTVLIDVLLNMKNFIEAEWRIYTSVI